MASSATRQDYFWLGRTSAVSPNILFLSRRGCLFVKNSRCGAGKQARSGHHSQFAELVSKSFSAMAHGIAGIIAAIVVIARLSRRPNVSDDVDDTACTGMGPWPITCYSKLARSSHKTFLPPEEVGIEDHRFSKRGKPDHMHNQGTFTGHSTAASISRHPYGDL